jgi:tRNA threonylcarbamoyladenosine biosynthesis protein TsaB
MNSQYTKRAGGAGDSPAVLAIDTTHELGSLALARGSIIVEEVSFRARDGFDEILYAQLRDLLLRNGVRLEDIDCFAAASGPGSFTGVRVGLACAQGLAEALGKPAAGVSNLEALATFGTAALRAPVFDARRGDVYGAVYDAAGTLISPEVAAKWNVWLDNLPDGELEFVPGDFKPVLAGTRFADAKVASAPPALAAAIARIAVARFLRGEAGDPAALDANYVRRCDAELFWKE